MNNAYTLPEGNVQIALSGGRTSAYMLHEILRVNGPLPERVIVSFQNTGAEDEATLEFVREIGERWGVAIVWVEYRGESPRFAVVDFDTASRHAEPFIALIHKRKFLPNQQSRFCTVELKIRAIKRYLLTLGWKRWTVATGIRFDEQRRLNNPKPKDRWVPWNPLADAGVTKHHVIAFWQRQPFDLALANDKGKTPDGNCKACFLKPEAYLAQLSVRDPSAYALFEGMEALATSLGASTVASFSKRYNRRELREWVERQGVLGLSEQGLLCQADGGECFG